MYRNPAVFGFLASTLLAGCAPPQPEVASTPQPAWPDQEQVGPTGLPANSGIVGPVAGAVPTARAQWDTRAEFPERRTEISVTGDGEYIYVAGGFGPPPEGSQQATAPRALWRYQPAMDQWTRLTDIPQGVNHAALVHHAGRLYILGGFRETSFEPIGNVRIYDLAAGTWSDGAPMPTPRGAMAFTLHNGRIHMIGGNAPGGHVHDHADAAMTDDRSVNIHEAYDPATNQWAQLAPMPTPRNHLAAVSLRGRIHALVGRADGDFELTTHEIYDPATNSWTAGPPVPTGRSGVAAVTLGDHLYLFGGETFGDNARTFGEAERFSATTNRWEALPPMPTPRHGLGAAVHGRSIHVISGGPSPGYAFSGANERLTIPAQ